MPNLKGFTPLQNPEWVSLDFDDGSSHPVHDPTGQYRQEVASIVPKVMGMSAPDPMAGALASNDLAGVSVMPTQSDAGGAAPFSVVPDSAYAAPPPPVSANPLGISAIGGAARPGQLLSDVAPAAPHAPGPVVGDPLRAIGASLAGQGASQFAPAPVHSLVQPRAVSDEAPRQSAPDPYAPRYMTQGASGPSVSATDSTTTQGLTKGDKATVDAANARAVESGRAADQGEYVAKANQFYSDWQRLGVDAQKQLAEKNAAEQQEREFNAKVDAQRQKNAETASRPIDPTEAFAGDGGAYAFMAAFGDAISNFGAALAGRGPVADPSARIESIINRSVKLQMEQKQADLEAGKITGDQLEADREHVRFKIATAAKQLIDTEAERAHTEAEYKGLGALKQRMSALQDEASAKNAMATARQQSTTHSASVTPGSPGGGGADYFLGEDQTKNGGWKAVEAHGARQAGGDQIESAVGRFSKATGYNWDPQALGGAGAFRDKDGKVVTADHADVPGTTALGTNLKLLSGETGREVQGALGDLAAGRAKIADPVGAVSDKSIDAQKEQMAAGTDEGAFRSMENAARQLKNMRAKVDSESSPGVVNASRLRRQEERGFQATRPGLPTSRPATADELRGSRAARPAASPALPDAPVTNLGEHYSYSSGVKAPAGKGHTAPKGHR